MSDVKSLREVAQQVDNEKDFKEYILSFSGKAGSRSSDIKYEKNPVSCLCPVRARSDEVQILNTQKQAPPPSIQPPSFNQSQPSLSSPSSFNPPYGGPPPQSGQVSGVTSSYAPPGREQGPYPPPQPYQQQASAQSPRYPSSSGAPQMAPIPHHEPLSISGTVGKPNGFQQAPPSPAQPINYRHDEPPLNPVFGISLDELFRREGSAVPMIVYQCIQAVDLFGLDVEGIYRTSGSTPNIQQMKQMFDNGIAHYSPMYSNMTLIVHQTRLPPTSVTLRHSPTTCPP